LVSDVKGGTQTEGVENTILRIFAPKREEMTGCWRKVHDEELNNLLFVKYN
jgi:hypothetical protein